MLCHKMNRKYFRLWTISRTLKMLFGSSQIMLENMIIIRHTFVKFMQFLSLKQKRDKANTKKY